jgi:RNA polymerase sigma-70 factor (ECF subfamily)
MTLPASRGFTTTRWTLVMKAARESQSGSGAALDELCTRYWPPLYGFARRRGYPVEQAQDLTQAFFARVLEKHALDAADQNRGRFRSFLLASFKHFLANDWDREHTLKRGGAFAHVALDLDTGEAFYAAQPVETLTPEMVFERQWALGILDRAASVVRGECVASGKEATFERLKGYLEGDKSEGSYADAARALGTTEGAVKVTVHRLRRRYREALRAEIASTVSDDSEIDDEIAHLITALGAR